MKKEIKKKGSKKLLALTITSLILVLLAAQVSALGISPAKKPIDFSTEEQTIGYVVINNEQRDLDLVVTATGELAPYITIPKERLSMSEDEETTSFEVKIKLPSELQPGERVGKIAVEEFIPEFRIGETFVQAKLRVVSKISVNVPYPEKYIGVKMDVEATKPGEPIEVKTEIINLGTKDIDKLKVDFGIYEEDKLIESRGTGESSLLRKESKELSSIFETEELKAGSYSAVATISYDDNSIELGKDFEIGGAYIKILDYTKYFVVDEINKFDLDVQSEWNQKIRDAYAKIKISDERKEIADLRSVSYDLNPGEKKIITSYWDTKGVALGDYEANMSLLYLNKTTTEIGEVHVVKTLPSKFGKTTPIIIGLGVVILALALILTFKMKKKSQKIEKTEKKVMLSKLSK